MASGTITEITGWYSCILCLLAQSLSAVDADKNAIRIVTMTTPKVVTTSRYIAPSELSCCQLGREIAGYGYKECTRQKHDIYKIDELVNSGNRELKKKKLIPLRLLKKCEYRYYESLSQCCSQVKKIKDFKTLILKAKKALRNSLSQYS